jgi:dihydrofolate reductase
MPLTQYYTATTLDGFIADPDHSLDWLFTRRQDPNGPLSYASFIADVGALAMGANTYEWVLRHEKGNWPYELPCWVFTHRDLPVAGERIDLTADDIAAVHERMRSAAGDRNVWIVGGGGLVGQFAERGLLDELIVYIAPVTLGAGEPLLSRHVELRLEELARNGDFACARYAVVRSTPPG